MLKAGDEVVCVDAEGTVRLRLGSKHIIGSTYMDQGTLIVSLLDVRDCDYTADRFILNEEKPNTVDEYTEKTSLKGNMTLPTDSKERKDYPLLDGCVRYFPAALAGVALISKKGNDKHNPGEVLHHARGKSMDHGDCILRHLIDVQDLLAKIDRGDDVNKESVLEEVGQLAWRVLAYSQELHEQFGAPLAPAAKK